MLRRAGAGNEAAVRAFVHCYERRVYSLCARVLGDVHSAEDAAQETFLKALSALPRFDVEGTARCSTWLLTIATHHCLDELRRRKRRPVLDDDAALAFLSAEVDTAQATSDRGARLAAERALQTLSDEHRAVVVLRVLADESVEDTAAILGIATGTVKSRLSRAKEALKAVFSGAQP